MSKTKFTKGPWLKSHSANCQVYVTHKDMRRNSGHFICTLSGRDEVFNAFLVAKSPCIYEKLNDVLSAIESSSNEIELADRICMMKGEIEKLLAEARGEK